MTETGGAPGAAITIDDFIKLDIRGGTVRAAEPLAAEPLAGARKPAIALRIDFGPELGVKESSAQITELCRPDVLVGRQVAAVVNLPERRIGRFVSEVLVLGFPDADGRVVLIACERPVPDGARLY